MAVPGKIQCYRCASCSSEVSADQHRLMCETCGGNYDIIYDHAAIAQHWIREHLAADRDLSLWRYLPLLPVIDAPAERSLLVGGTPLVDLGHRAHRFDLKKLWIKDDSRLPSGSLKDRASEVALRHASEIGNDTLIAASTGNAAASLACLAAWHGMHAVILAPASAPPAKLAQILQYGATLIPVHGSYDQAFDLSLELAEQLGSYVRSTGVNPVLAEGKKTVALEIAEQTGWQLPEVLFAPVGDGCIIAGVHKGFVDLQALGWIDHIPQLVAVQAKGSSAVIDAFEQDRDVEPVHANTIADSISVDLPRDGAKAVRAIKETGGFGVRVSDDEILAAQHDLASSTGVFAEPAAAAAWAGLLKVFERGQLDGVENAMVLITGSGLKDIDAARRAVEHPEPVEPDIDSVLQALKWGRS